MSYLFNPSIGGKYKSSTHAHWTARSLKHKNQGMNSESWIKLQLHSVFIKPIVRPRTLLRAKSPADPCSREVKTEP